MVFLKTEIHILANYLRELVRAFSRDTGMTFIPERAHSISVYFSLLYFFYSERKFCSRASHSGISSFRFSFLMKFSFWCEISFWYHVNWRRTSFRIENRKSCSLGASCARVTDLARKPRDRERQWSLSYECGANFILERNSFRNESHSGIMSTAPKCMNELFVPSSISKSDSSKTRTSITFPFFILLFTWSDTRE